MDKDDLLPGRNIRYRPPNIESDFKNTLLPAILQCCAVVDVYSIFDFATCAKAVEQLSARRKQIKDQLLKMDAVSGLTFYYITICSLGPKT